MRTPPDIEQFRRQERDLYVPQADLGFWQAAIRDPEHPQYGAIVAAIEAGRQLSVDLLYADHEGGQRTVSRFAFQPCNTGDRTVWQCSVVRHWNIDRDDPR